MSLTTYTYNIISDFNGVLDVGRLDKDIRDYPGLVTALDGVNLDQLSGTVYITFREQLSSNEKSLLDGYSGQQEAHPPIAGSLLASHTGKPVKNNEILRASYEKVSLQEFWFHTPNWCDPTTWYPRSQRVVGEVLQAINPSDRRHFKFKHQNIIDLVHGKVPNEDTFSLPYLCNIYVDAQKKQETNQLLYNMPAKDYTINYREGRVSFASPIPENSVVTADYSYSNDSTFIIDPKPGKKILMQGAEAEFTTDFDMRDTVIYQAFIYAQVAAAVAKIDLPTLQYALTLQYGGTRDALMSYIGLVDGYGQPLQRDLQPLDRVPVDTELRKYKTYWDFKAQSNGNYSIVPPVGGTVRGTRSQSITHPYDYRGVKEVDSSIGAQVRIWLENHIPYGNENSIATAVFYCLIEDV